MAAPEQAGHRVIDTDMAAILYTSGSTGKPKGVVLSHRNMVAGAKSVAPYLENHADDTLLAALPLSFDAGFSQLTTAFHVGARVVLINYLLPRDVLNALVAERVTGLTAVPPLWIQLAQLKWPETIAEHLRYIANTGGRMPLETLKALRAMLPRTKPYLMYGLTEAFRSTYLPPEEVDRRPDSIGKAIPNAEILVLREDGTPLRAERAGRARAPGRAGRHGLLERPGEDRRALQAAAAPGGRPRAAGDRGVLGRHRAHGRRGLPLLRRPARRDDQDLGLPREPDRDRRGALRHAARRARSPRFGVPHPVLGQAIVVVATPKPGAALDGERLLAECRDRLPAYMVPAKIDVRGGPLPRNPNGKIDRKALAAEFERLFEQAPR